MVEEPVPGAQSAQEQQGVQQPAPPPAGAPPPPEAEVPADAAAAAAPAEGGPPADPAPAAPAEGAPAAPAEGDAPSAPAPAAPDAPAVGDTPSAPALAVPDASAVGDVPAAPASAAPDVTLAVGEAPSAPAPAAPDVPRAVGDAPSAPAPAALAAPVYVDVPSVPAPAAPVEPAEHDAPSAPAPAVLAAPAQVDAPSAPAPAASVDPEPALPDQAVAVPHRDVGEAARAPVVVLPRDLGEGTAAPTVVPPRDLGGEGTPAPVVVPPRDLGEEVAAPRLVPPRDLGGEGPAGPVVVPSRELGEEVAVPRVVPPRELGEGAPAPVVVPPRDLGEDATAAAPRLVPPRGLGPRESSGQEVAAPKLVPPCELGELAAGPVVVPPRDLADGVAAGAIGAPDAGEVRAELASVAALDLTDEPAMPVVIPPDDVVIVEDAADPIVISPSDLAEPGPAPVLVPPRDLAEAAPAPVVVPPRDLADSAPAPVVIPPRDLADSAPAPVVIPPRDLGDAAAKQAPELGEQAPAPVVVPPRDLQDGSAPAQALAPVVVPPRRSSWDIGGGSQDGGAGEPAAELEVGQVNGAGPEEEPPAKRRRGAFESGEVQFAAKEMAEAARQMLDGSLITSRATRDSANISVALDLVSECTLLVHNLPAGIDAQELKNHFSAAGTVVSATVAQSLNRESDAQQQAAQHEALGLGPNPSGTALALIGHDGQNLDPSASQVIGALHYKSPAAAQAAVMLDGSELRGARLTVCLDLSIPGGCKVVVSNLPEGCTSKELKTFFAIQGEIPFASIQMAQNTSQHALVPAQQLPQVLPHLPQHVAGSRTCKFYMSPMGCKKGSACNFVHPTYSYEEQQAQAAQGYPQGYSQEQAQQMQGFQGQGGYQQGQEQVMPGMQWNAGVAGGGAMAVNQANAYDQPVQAGFQQGDNVGQGISQAGLNDFPGIGGNDARVGVVYYKTPAAAQQAIQMFDGSDFWGCTVRVWADSSYAGGCKLVVSNLPPGCSGKDLAAHCAMGGEFPFASIQYGSGSQAQPAQQQQQQQPRVIVPPSMVHSQQGMMMNSKVCRYHNSPEGCRFGNTCRFPHVTPDQWAAQQQQQQQQVHIQQQQAGGMAEVLNAAPAGLAPVVAVVQYSSGASAAAAIQLLHGSDLRGSRLVLKPDPAVNGRVMVSNLPHGCMEEELKSHCLVSGEVPIVEIQQSGISQPQVLAPGHPIRGVVMFRSPEAAQAAAQLLDGGAIRGAALSARPDTGDPSGCRVVVTNLPSDCDWQELRNHCMAAGEVRVALIQPVLSGS